MLVWTCILVPSVNFTMVLTRPLTLSPIYIIYPVIENRTFWLWNHPTMMDIHHNLVNFSLLDSSLLTTLTIYCSGVHFHCVKKWRDNFVTSLFRLLWCHNTITQTSMTSLHNEITLLMKIPSISVKHKQSCMSQHDTSNNENLLFINLNKIDDDNSLVSSQI